ncbi:unnamed protein product [Closterium sp. Yama58-4]|nr:unnamed protein product [Closterium sp. Yama58-4]
MATSSSMALVGSLLSIINEISALGDRLRSHKRSCQILIRRIKLLAPLFEEIRDVKSPLPPAAVVAFQSMRAALSAAKTILVDCSSGSRIWMVMEREAMAERMRAVNLELSGALADLPMNVMAISEEIQEQTQLVQVQLKRSRALDDAQEEQLYADVRHILSDPRLGGPPLNSSSRHTTTAAAAAAPHGASAAASQGEADCSGPTIDLSAVPQSPHPSAPPPSPAVLSSFPSFSPTHTDVHKGAEAAAAGVTITVLSPGGAGEEGAEAGGSAAAGGAGGGAGRLPSLPSLSSVEAGLLDPVLGKLGLISLPAVLEEITSLKRAQDQLIEETDAAVATGKGSGGGESAMERLRLRLNEELRRGAEMSVTGEEEGGSSGGRWGGKEKDPSVSSKSLVSPKGAVSSRGGDGRSGDGMCSRADAERRVAWESKKAEKLRESGSGDGSGGEEGNPEDGVDRGGIGVGTGSALRSKSGRLVVPPDDFRCPISLEIMRDPVIVSTGQTYDRAYIEQWLKEGHKTCPKTQQILSQPASLIPNFSLRSLIQQWCEANNVELPNGGAGGSGGTGEGGSAEISLSDRHQVMQIRDRLRSPDLEVRKSAAVDVRLLAKRSVENRVAIAEGGVIPLLVELLTDPLPADAKMQEHTVTALLNLSINDPNKSLIVSAGAIPAIVRVLEKGGSMEARENAAAALFSLSVMDENKISIGQAGAIPALVDLLQHGSTRGKKDAATAIFNLSIYQGNKARAVRAGVVAPLVDLLVHRRSGMMDEALAILAVLSTSPEGRTAIGEASAVPILVELMKDGSPRNKENAASVLLSLCLNGREHTELAVQCGAVPPLQLLLRSGTPRAKRKASQLLQHLQDQELMAKRTFESILLRAHPPILPSRRPPVPLRSSSPILSPTSLPSRRSPRRPRQRLETPSRRPPLSHLVAPLVALANAPKLPPYAHPLSHPVAPLVALANAPKLPPVAHPLSHPIAPLVPRFKRLKTPSRRPPLSHPVAPLVALANASKLPPVAHPSPISSLPSSPSPTPRNSLRTRILSPIPSLPSSPSPTPRNFLPSRILSPIPSLPSSPVSNASKLPPVAHLSPIPSLPSSPSPTPRNSLPSPLLSLRSPCSLSIALALSPSPLLSLRRPCFLSVALALSPSPLLSLRRPCPLSVAPALSPSPLLSLRRHFSLPSRVLSPVALSLSRCPFSLSLPFHPPVTLPLSRRLSSPPSPFLSPGALALSRFLSSLPSSHVALDAVVTFPLSPPVTHLGAFALSPKCLQVALCFSPPISQHPTVPHVSLHISMAFVVRELRMQHLKLAPSCD